MLYFINIFKYYNDWKFRKNVELEPKFFAKTFNYATNKTVNKNQEIDQVIYIYNIQVTFIVHEYKSEKEKFFKKYL